MPAEDYLHPNGLLGWIARWSGDYTRDTQTPPSLFSTGNTGNGLLMKLAGNGGDKADDASYAADSQVGYSLPNLAFAPPSYAANSDNSADNSFTEYADSTSSNTPTATPGVFSGDTILDRPVELMSDKGLQLSVHMGSDWVQHIAAKELSRRAAMRYLSDAPVRQTLDQDSDTDNAAYGEPPPHANMQPAATPAPADAGVLLSGDNEPGSVSEHMPDPAAASSPDRSTAEASAIAINKSEDAPTDDSPIPQSEADPASDIAAPDEADGAAEKETHRRTEESSNTNSASSDLVPSSTGEPYSYSALDGEYGDGARQGSAYYALTPSQFNGVLAKFGPVDPDHLNAQQIVMASQAGGSFVTAEHGDSVSQLIGASNPQAVGNFMRANSLTNSMIYEGQSYLTPDSTTAYGDNAALGQDTLNADNARLRQIADTRAAALGKTFLDIPYDTHPSNDPPNSGTGQGAPLVLGPNGGVCDGCAPESYHIGQQYADAGLTPPSKRSLYAGSTPLTDPLTRRVVLGGDGKPVLLPLGSSLLNEIMNAAADRQMETDAISRTVNTVEDLAKFKQGGQWDLQRLTGKFNSNYIDGATVVIGIYGAAAGLSQDNLLTIQNRYAWAKSNYPEGTIMDSTYTHLPARNVVNTNIGYQWFSQHVKSQRLPGQ